MQKSKTFLNGLLAGAIVGAVAGLFLAPKTGNETRHLVGTRSQILKNRKDYIVEGLSRRFKKEPAPVTIENDVMEEHGENGA